MLGRYTLGSVALGSKLDDGGEVEQPIGDIAFTVNAPTFSASANASLPQPIADVAFTLNAPVFNASASASAPSGNLYYLQFDGVDDYVSTGVVANGQNSRLYVKFKTNSITERQELIHGEGGGQITINRYGNGVVNCFFNIDEVWYGVTTGVVLQEDKITEIEAVYDGSSVSLYIDGVMAGSETVGGSITREEPIRIGAHINGSGPFNGDLYRAEIDTGNSFHLYDPSISNGTGQILPDTAGLNDGALVNFPTDDSQWVQYASAAPSADVNFTLSTPVFAASADATLPQPSASIAYNINAPTFTVGATVTLPNPTAAVAYTVNAPTFSVSGEVTIPQPTANASFSLPVPTIAASATATEPNFNASVNFALPSPTFSAEATATLPQPESTVSLAVSPPNVSVVAIVGGIAIIVDEETNINQRVMSNNINAPILSNNING